MARDWFWAILTVSILSVAIAHPAFAHGCEGDFACATNPQHQWEQQQQQQQANPSANVNTSSVFNDRYMNIRPVQPLAPPSVTPSATISRYADLECQPRMKIIRLSVNGLNNRPMSAAEFEAGTDEYVVPDLDEPYRRVTLVPGLTRLIGHRMIETSAVTTVSTGYAWGLGGGNSHGGGSIGAGGSSGLQRVVTTIRLQECTAYEIDTRPKPPEAEPKIITKWKTRTVERLVPVIPCQTCVSKP